MVSLSTVRTFLTLAKEGLKDDPETVVAQTAASLGTGGAAGGTAATVAEAAEFVDQHQGELRNADSPEEVGEIVYRHARSETPDPQLLAGVVKAARKEGLL